MNKLQMKVRRTWASDEKRRLRYGQRLVERKKCVAPGQSRVSIAAPTRASTPARRSHARSSGLFGEGRLVDKFSAAPFTGRVPVARRLIAGRFIAALSLALLLAFLCLGYSHPAPTRAAAGPAQPAALTATLVINELHYHAASDAYAEEYVELYNAGAAVADLTGWTFSDGIAYTFPTGTLLLPGAYLVVAADPPTLAALYGVTGALGPFADGRLSNSGETVALSDAGGVVVDEVTYGDASPWPDAADGDGPSLELINPAFNHASPCSWAASAGNGTPGAQNSAYLAGNLPPCIIAPLHTPTLPISTDPVAVSAFVDDNSAVVSVTLHYRVQGQSEYNEVAMERVSGEVAAIHEWDTNTRITNDESASQRIMNHESRITDTFLPPTPYSLLPTPSHVAIIPALSLSGTLFTAPGEGRYVEFYITATDDEGAVRVSPEGAPGGVSGETGRALTRSYLYWVEDTHPQSDLPLYRVLLTDQNRAELEARSLYSNVLLDATFVYSDTTYYNVGLRYRGESSRPLLPRPYRIKFNDAQEFASREHINLNGDEIHREALAYDLFQRAGLPAPDARLVTLYLNGEHSGAYVDVEEVDRDFLKAHFGDDNDGALYRGVEHADLGYYPGDLARYVDAYEKITHADAADYTDVISLTAALAAPDATFIAEAQAVADMPEWLRWFAVNAVLDNHEGALWIGPGDDFFLYRRGADGRFVLLPWDLDGAFTAADHTVWEPDWYASETVRRILHTPVFTRLYYQAIADLISGPFAVAEMLPRIDALPDSAVRPEDKQELRDFVTVRVPNLWTQIPGDRLGVVTNGGTDIVTTDESVTLEGTCSPLRDVTVNDSADGVVYLTATSWRYTAQLTGRDNVFVVADGQDATTLTIFRDLFHGGPLTADTVLTGSRLPYTIHDDIRLSGAITLTVEPGATLRFDAGRLMRVEDGARLWIHGTAEQPAVLTAAEGQTWGGILLWSTRSDNLIEHAVIEHVHEVLLNPRTHGVTAFASDITIRDSVLRHMRHSVAVTADYGSTLYLLRNEIYDIGTDAVHATGGVAVIQGNHIHDSYYDLSFNPAPPEGIEISRIGDDAGEAPAYLLDNRIHDITDDCLDLNDSSAVIERNIVHDCGDKGISMGGAISGTLTNNLVYECRANDNDPARTGFGIALKDGATAFLAHNTLVSNTHGLGLYEMHAGAGGATATVVNSIIWGNDENVVSRDGSSLTVSYSNLPGGWPGEGNRDADPLFRSPLARNYRLQKESPCIDTAAPAGAPSLDANRVARPQGAGYDRGAFEFFEFHSVYLPVTLR